MTTRQYNVNNVKIVLTAAGIPYSIDCRHEDGFEDDPSSESSSSTIASCGQKVVNVSVDESTAITMNMLYGSEEHRLMERLHKLWKANKGLFPMFIVLTDLNVNETYIYNSVSFKKKAGLKYANESGTEARTWEFDAESREFVG
ncbi:hypothetical protein JMUB3935_2341 [Leptotrichia trevisanii]|uniref:Phage protein n=1 Tax=Leptotrichia trevisanii TaxID=109328 RepID=A0A510KNW8_9FUSO|nr:phage protein [Leptotrichia trevisanii]BBM53354.1 hypothetical protein JMUB3935_2341 [Leptotrichia trevisanii]